MDPSNWKILLVEDNEDDFIITRMMLSDVRGGRFRMTWVVDIEQGLAALGTDCPDVVLVDYYLGPENGLDFIRAMRARGCRAPVILLTGRSSYTLDVTAMQAGADDFLEKSSLTGAALERSIRYALERRQFMEHLQAANAGLSEAKAELEVRVNARTRALAEANQLLERVFSTIHLCVAYMDRDFNVIRVNQGYASAYGRDEAFFRGKNYFALNPNAETEAIFREVVRSGNPYQALARPFSFPEHPERGVTYWDWGLQAVKQPDGAVDGLVLSLLDVTEQQRTRQALQEVQARERAVVSGAPIILCSIDRNYTLTLVEGRGLSRLGLAADTLLGRPIEPFFDSFPEARGAVERALAGEEVTALLPVAPPVDEVLEGRFSPLVGPGGDITGVICVLTFITERVRAEEQSRRLIKRLEAQTELSRVMAEARLDLTLMLNILAERTASELGDACAVAVLDEDTGALRPAAFYHPEASVGEALVTWMVAPGHEPQWNVLNAAITRGETILAPVIEDGLPVTPEVDAIQQVYQDRIHSLLVVPMRVAGRIIGAVCVSRDRPGNPYTVEDQYFLEALAGRAALAIANARLYQAIQRELAERRRVQAELNEIQSRLIDGAEAERMLLARELHDGPIQNLYAAQFQLRALQESWGDGNTAGVETLQDALQAIVKELRATTMNLRPPTLTRFGLAPAIRAHSEEFNRTLPDLRFHLDVEEEGDGSRDSSHDSSRGGENGLSERVRLALFRIYQVALTNVARHAQAKNVTVRLRIGSEKALLEVVDDGVGFTVPDRWVELARQGHLGLVGAIERVDALGGQMQVLSLPGKGTTIRVTVPKIA